MITAIETELLKAHENIAKLGDRIRDLERKLEAGPARPALPFEIKTAGAVMHVEAHTTRGPNGLVSSTAEAKIEVGSLDPFKLRLHAEEARRLEAFGTGPVTLIIRFGG